MIQLQYPIKKLPEPFNSMAMIGGVFIPIVTQPFGANYVDFYAKLGMKGHNGIDYMAPRRTEIYVAHNGKITKIYDKNNASRTIGYGIWVMHPEGWQTAYFHLDEVLVKVGDIVKAGDLIGYADNTGEYTTGDHLHFGLYSVNPDFGNGYNGAIDPTPYFNQFKNNKMTLKIYQGNQYIVDEHNKFAWSIPNEQALADIKKHFQLIGNPLGEEAVFDPTGYYVIHGGSSKSIKEFFNII